MHLGILVGLSCQRWWLRGKAERLRLCDPLLMTRARNHACHLGLESVTFLLLLAVIPHLGGVQMTPPVEPQLCKASLPHPSRACRPSREAPWGRPILSPEDRLVGAAG